MQLLTSAAQLRTFHGCILVPTMGALHEGHASLIRQAAAISDERKLPALVTIFVNPTQFNDPRDLERYPRTLEADAALCESAGADAVFAPAPSEIYPPGITIPTTPLPPVATEPKLEDAARPGHFAGVCQVVQRLFDLTLSSAAVFGEKDWQQLCVVRAMTTASSRPVEIIPGPTVREPDGLAMSSRNRFLTPEDRPRAAAVSAALCAAAGERSPEGAERVMRDTLGRAGLAIEYAVVRDAETLLAPRPDHPLRALIAARLGAVRLIDNACQSPGHPPGT